MRISLSIAFVLCAMSLRAAETFVYTNNNSAVNSVSAFSVSAGGGLTAVSGSPFATGGSAAPVTLSQATNQIVSTTAKNFLYVTNLASNNISAFAINASTGVLNPVPGSPFPSGFTFQGQVPFGLAITPDDKFMFVATYDAGQIAVDRIGANGALAPIAGSPFTTVFQLITAGTAALKVTPDGRFLAVASITNIQAGVVGMFSIASTGVLTALPQSEWGQVGEATWIDCNCASNHIYTGSEYQTRIDALNIASDGALSPIAGSPFTGPNGDSRNVLLSADDSKLFVSQQTSNTILAYSVAANGALTLVPGSPFSFGGVSPGSLATNQAGTFLYAAQTNSNLINAFRIASSGALTLVSGSPFSSGASGTGPLSLTVFPPKDCCAAPVIGGASAKPDVLWPPNHKMVEVTIDYPAPVTCAHTCVLTVSSSEPPAGAADGKNSADWQVIDAHHLLLLAERTGSGGDRIYTITITCTNDVNQLSSSQTVAVRVPHDQGK